MFDCLALAMIPHNATNSPEAKLDGLFQQAKASLLRGRGLRIETGKILYEIQTLCEQNGLRDYTKRVTEELGLPERTARDYRNEYLKSLTAANFAGDATEAEEGPSEESSQDSEKEATASEGGNSTAGTQNNDNKKSRKSAEGFYVRFLYLPKGMDKKVRDAAEALGYERAAAILIAEAAKLTSAPLAA